MSSKVSFWVITISLFLTISKTAKNVATIYSFVETGNKLKNDWDTWIKAGCLASEMETAALYTVSSIRRVRSCSILTAIWNQEQNNELYSFDVEKSIKVAIAAIKLLINK